MKPAALKHAKTAGRVTAQRKTAAKDAQLIQMRPHRKNVWVEVALELNLQEPKKKKAAPRKTAAQLQKPWTATTMTTDMLSAKTSARRMMPTMAQKISRSRKNALKAATGRGGWNRNKKIILSETLKSFL